MFFDSCKALGRLLAASLACLPVVASAQNFQVAIDTTPLSGQSGFIAFDLYQGDPGTSNQVVVTAFTTTSQLGTASVFGNVVGGLATTLTLSSTNFFSEYLQGTAFAAGVTSFTVSLGDQYTPGNIPDSFAIFLLDASGVPFATSDPNGADALVAVDLRAPLAPQVFESSAAAATVTPLSAVPEPSAALLLGLGLLPLLSRAGRRQQQCMPRV